MTDHDALLRSILEHPQEDLPRLVYADWLDDAGEVDRAAFVRVQVELARTGADVLERTNPYTRDGGAESQRQTLRRRERELLNANESAWTGSFVGLPEWGWKRGFISSVTLSWSNWLRHHAGLFWSPRQTVECPECRDVEHNYPMELHSRMYGSCKTCSGAGRIPRPFVPTAQPLETVRLTTGNWRTLPSQGTNHVMVEGQYPLDRVKCGVCEGRGIDPLDMYDYVSCPSCHGTPLNLWECPAWPGLEFVMPALSFPASTTHWRVYSSRGCSDSNTGDLRRSLELARRLTDPAPPYVHAAPRTSVVVFIRLGAAMSNDALRKLQDAAREYARLVLPGSTPRRVVILDEHRERIVEIRVPCVCEPAVGSPPTLPPAPLQQGWDFSEPWPRFDGTILQVSGKCLELLRALAEAKGPLTVDELRRKVWSEYLAEEVTIRWTVKKLRKLLKEQVPLCEEPIVTRPEGGYVLTLR